MQEKNNEKVIKLTEPHTVQFIKKLKEKNKDAKIISVSGKEF